MSACVVRACVPACVRDVYAIYDKNILPRLIMIIIKIIILYFIQITHTDDFPTTGSRLVYINDLALASTQLYPNMFADDTTLLNTLENFTSNHSSNSLSYNVNAEITKITQWLAVNRLSLNAKKTKMMIFHSKQNKLSVNEIPIIKINDMPIEIVTEFKFLGVHIYSNLTRYLRRNYIANELSRICGVVSRLKHYVHNTLPIIYTSVFLSHISYGITSWGFIMCTRIIKMQTKVISNSKFNSHVCTII